MVEIGIEGVVKRFGEVEAVGGVTLQVRRGELFFLLGPSGCGKTTLLRMIAGFETPDAGHILFDGRMMDDVPPNRRNTGMVFQNYALWPHLTVFRNVSYGLEVRKVGRQEKRRRVMEALELVRLGGLEGRYPTELSGGQQQRVALARALVIEPEAVLLDEPLSNLDAKLRLDMRREIKRIHAETGITMVYVTHDQKEALSLAQRLAVMREGRVEQTGSPEEVYRNPANAFVAEFIGQANLVKGRVVGAGTEGSATVATGVGEIVARTERAVKEGEEVVCSVRPESVRLQRGDSGFGIRDSEGGKGGGGGEGMRNAARQTEGGQARGLRIERQGEKSGEAESTGGQATSGTLGMRNERHGEGGGGGEPGFGVEVLGKTYLGETVQYVVRGEGGVELEVMVMGDADPKLEAGEKGVVTFAEGEARIVGE